MPSSKNTLPTVEHLYQNFSMDALRWNYFTPRADDIVVATTYKAGTTWAQTIVANLVFAGKLPGSIPDLSPWIDQRIFPLELVLSRLDQQSHRRAVKTHLPLDGLPFHRNIRYLCVGRDPRDIFMSFWNMYRNFTPEMLSLTNVLPGRVGEELRPCPEDVHELWRNWMTRPCFPWEHDGYPFGSVLHHTRTWWDYRHLPNILLVHFADLLVDLEGEIRRIARFFGTQSSGGGVADDRAQLHLRGNEEAWRRIDAAGEDDTQGRERFFFPQGDQRPLARCAR